MGTFYVENFGCRATQADGAAIERQFLERGLARASHKEGAEIVVLNTCTVTASADQDARAAIRRIQRENSDCRIVVTGCYAQRAPEEIAALPGVHLVVGNSHKHEIAALATTAMGGGSSAAVSKDSKLHRSDDVDAEGNTSTGDKAFVPLTALGKVPTGSSTPILVSDIFAHTELQAAPVFDAANERTRPNLKVQDGCDNRCSFCVIPSVRGQSRSLALESVLREVNQLVDSGYREVVISGINLGRWGRDFEKSLRFEVLVSAILEHTSLEKLRISSVEPMDWSDELIGLMANSQRIAKHAHVPMQSGSDRVLRGMHRKYRPWHYREKIQRIREALPDAAIGADVMVGFPGETEADFAETRQMIEALPFTYLHVFTYSARPGTPAADRRDMVPVQVARRRNQILRELAAVKKLEFMQSFAGRTVEAITLNEGGAASTKALTDNYLPLHLAGNHEANLWVKAQLEYVSEGVLVGVLAPEQELASV